EMDTVVVFRWGNLNRGRSHQILSPCLLLKLYWWKRLKGRDVWLSHPMSFRKCSVCQKGFPSASKLQRHYLIHTGQKPFICLVCGKAFRSSRQLQRHLPVHSQPKPFECNICGKTFRLRAHLKIMRVNHECPTCSKTFCSPSKLKRHFLTHTGQRPFSCEECGKKFRQVSHLKTHLYASHHTSNLRSVGTKQKGQPIDTKNTNVEIQCEISVSAPQNPDKFETKSPFSVKVEPHVSGSSQIRCSICSKTFISSVRHRHHYMAHKEVRPFQCRVCGRAFRLSTHLKRHQVSHRKPEKTRTTTRADNHGDAVTKTEQAYVDPHWTETLWVPNVREEISPANTFEDPLTHSRVV
uniref:C2H2-type domain-containing protein n=1 Tax=Esox lucius TaxID=8010 RepID=A0AAY5KBP4_ESOLU